MRDHAQHHQTKKHYRNDKLRIRTNTIIIMFAMLIMLDVGRAQDLPTDAQTQQLSTEKGESEHQLPNEIRMEQRPNESTREEILRVPLTEVIGTGPEALEPIPGSGRGITLKEIWENHRVTVNEALREVPPVHVRDEDRLGLRPNV